MRYSENKYHLLEKLSDKNGIIAALAIDQRGAMRSMIPNLEGEERDSIIRDFKKNVSEILTPYSSSILLDPIYGLDSIEARDSDAGLLMAYEVTGYRDDLRRPSLLEDWSVKGLKEKGAEAIKILLYYDVDDSRENNELKEIFIERVGSECLGEDIPFFLEIITYDKNIQDSKSKEFAVLKPHKVNKAIEEFVKPRYNVDVLKLEVPVNMKYVEGYGEDFVYTKEEAAMYFKEQSDLCSIPFIFLSAGVSTDLFLETLKFAHNAGSQFNGVLCGRATWAGGLPEFLKDRELGREWLLNTGVDNINTLNEVLKSTAVSWKKNIG
ncbi:tagatose 1,6-diphosphate aldolase [Microaceticoccus formicicus]|uniref:tagatose 1,6-diphosphate aldolase n=1 Tax=Microaceticoccus formicicus TaxID=3118105 RepID=UPI003CD01BCD|nr:tagatose 1,6-diphosphate aldolase [Peptoniphilaceae bacterium AMB_02]